MTLLRLLRTDYCWSNEEITNFIKQHDMPMRDYDNCVALVESIKRNEFQIHRRTRPSMLATHLMQANNLWSCDDCRVIEHCDELTSVNHGDYSVCDTCLDADYYYSERHDTYRHNDDYDEDDYDEYNDNGCYSYDTDVLGYVSKQSLKHEQRHKDLQYYGIELEVERRRDCPYDIAESINCMFDDFAICKNDGSLDNGFEIVTAPATYGYHKKRWEDFFNSKLCQENLKGWNTDTAGLHIHIGRKTLRPTDIGKILVFVNDDTNADFINGIAGRSSQQWAKRTPKKVSDVLRPSGEKYEAVNTNHYHTIELRIFRSNITRHGFYRVLEFTDALVNFVKLGTSLANTTLHYKAFCHFVSKPEWRSQYPNLLAWLIRNRYVKDMQPSRNVVVADELETATN